MNRKIKITVCIFTYRPGDGFESLLSSINKQKINSNIDMNIIVNQDSENDYTIKNICNKVNKKINYISSKRRLGFAGSAKKDTTFFNKG